ncbi:MAG: GNAT family N-acetyltransferase [Ktedonobacterales bacterium]
MSDSEQPLETARLLLEPLVVSHAAALFAALQAPDLYTFIPQDPPPSAQSLAARYATLATRRSPDRREVWLNWALRLRATSAYVGIVEVTVHADRTAMLAYMVFPPFWRQGYATEACGRVLAHLFADSHVSRVAAEIDTRNAASIHLVEALGFTRAATTPNADFFKGSASDEYRYVLSDRRSLTAKSLG